MTTNYYQQELQKLVKHHLSLATHIANNEAFTIEYEKEPDISALQWIQFWKAFFENRK